VKRVVMKVTQKPTGGWAFQVSVDGEEFASGVTPTFLIAVGSASHYAASLEDEA
jgi:hypothetical protein